jgi:hypothetical protein
LAEAQRRTEECVRQLVEAQRRTEERLARLEERVDRIEDKLGRLDGRTLELIYDKKASAYFGRWLRRAEVVGSNEVWDLLEERLSPDELHEVLLTDLLVRGRATHRPDRPEVWLAVEISAVVDRDDIARAVRRAELLRRAGVAAVPVVAETSATEGAESEANSLGVAMLQDGSGRLWDQAFAAWPV